MRLPQGGQEYHPDSSPDLDREGHDGGDSGGVAVGPRGSARCGQDDVDIGRLRASAGSRPGSLAQSVRDVRFLSGPSQAADAGPNAESQYSEFR